MRQYAVWARANLNYANVMATVALFIALGGGAYALARDSVGSREIQNGSVRSQELNDDDVRGADIESNAVQGSDVADDSLTGADVEESSLLLPPPDTAAQLLAKLITVDGRGSGLDADTLDETESDDVLKRSTFNSATGLRVPTYLGYFAITTEADTFEFRAIEVRTTGTPHEFQVCSNANNNARLVAYVNGVRSLITTEDNSNCIATLDPGAGGDFQIYGAGVMIWGVSNESDGPASNVFNLYGIDAAR